MKIGFVIFAIIFLSAPINAKAQSTKGNNYHLKVEKFIKDNISGTNYWGIKCTLANHSKDTLNYLSMSCSWTDFYSLDKKGLEIDGFECDRNIPVILELAPGESRSVVLRIYQGKNFKNINSAPLKVGLNIIQTKSIPNYNPNVKPEHILWSNTISLW